MDGSPDRVLILAFMFASLTNMYLADAAERLKVTHAASSTMHHANELYQPIPPNE